MNNSLIIYVAASCRSKVFTKRELTWGEFLKRLQQPIVSHLSAAEYAKLSSEAKAAEKDKGCFIAADSLVGGSRKAANVGKRTLLIYDIDNSLPLKKLKEIYATIPYELVVHSTRSHTPEKPRHRLILPIDSSIPAAAYKYVAESIGSKIHDLSFYDSACFDLSRVMHFPSIHSDGGYEFYHKEGVKVNVEECLKEIGLQDIESKKNNKLEDPKKKKGIIGDFCRKYPIKEAINTFLADVYIAGNIPNRYTYSGASGANGAIVYEDMHLYSNHATDPACGKTYNSFDLVRVHKFGHLDKEANIQTENLPSYNAMLVFAKAKLDNPSANVEFNWFTLLERSSKGEIKPSVSNIRKIMMNDPVLKDLYATNEFDGDVYRTRKAPWCLKNTIERVTDLDDHGLRNYFSEKYGIVNKGAIEDIFEEISTLNVFHPIKDMIEAEKWDGIPRIDTVLIDLFGVEDNVYHRTVMRISMLGMVSRVYNPGCKFDLMPILTGAQGRGKSTFIRKLAGGKYYNDSFYFDFGKAGMEQLRGVWVFEIPELANLRKKEDAEYKAFLSKMEDTYRPAYARRSIRIPRQCVFWGSTNEDFFLRDVTGNRRFLPVNIGNGLGTPKEAAAAWEKFEKSIPQLYAEALVAYINGELPYLADESIATPYREAHLEVDERSGQVMDYLDAPVLPNWYSLTPRSDLSEIVLTPEELTEAGYIRRPFVCAMEIWVECFNKPKSEATRANLKQVHAIMKNYPDWKIGQKVQRFKEYGIQKVYERVERE